MNEGNESKFPKYNEIRRTGERGVTFVKGIIEDFGWRFRQTHQEDDFGIDGYIDIVSEEGRITGKLIGVQIKTGESFFKWESANGWLFRGEVKHLNYYSNLDFPVLIILVDLQTRVAYWDKFDIHKTTGVKNGWSMVIPKFQQLDTHSKSVLRKLPGLEVDYMTQIEAYWEGNKLLENGGVIILDVSKEDIINKNLDGFTLLKNRLTVSMGWSRLAGHFTYESLIETV